MAQFFEMRYSKKFRVFAGGVCWCAGVINMGVFPGVGARFFINFCGLPTHIFGLIETFPVVMILLLSVSYVFTVSGNYGR